MTPSGCIPDNHWSLMYSGLAVSVVPISGRQHNHQVTDSCAAFVKVPGTMLVIYPYGLVITRFEILMRSNDAHLHFNAGNKNALLASNLRLQMLHKLVPFVVDSFTPPQGSTQLFDPHSLNQVQIFHLIQKPCRCKLFNCVATGRVLGTQLKQFTFGTSGVLIPA